MPSFPWTKSELALRLRAVKQGWWNDSILVFKDCEVYAVKCEVAGEKIRVRGAKREMRDGNADQVAADFVVDPREVSRVVH
jgi:hypothetical protein